MIKNYLKIAFRSLIKQKIYSVINILGLAAGIASCVLIVMFVMDEFSYDSFHGNRDRIYKLALERKYPNHSTNYAVVPHSFADAIQQDFPEVETVVKMGGPFNNTGVTYKNERGEEKLFEENFIMAADSNFFNVFSIKILQGDAEKALLKPSDIVLTEETARRYFGEERAIGKTVQIFQRDYSVSAICERVPENSHMKFDFLFKWDDQFLANGQPNFTGFNSHIYLQLKPGADAGALEKKFPKMVDTYASAQIETGLHKSWEDYKKEGNGYRYFLQPLTRIHLDPTHIEGKIRPGGNLNYVYFLISIAALILAIACINFMNLATARSAERGREVGVRKTMGSLKSQLVNQFLVESILVALFATLLALAIIYTALPYFNNLTGKHLPFVLNGRLMAGLIGITLLVGLLAGSYPAFVLSSFNPVMVMKGKFSGNAKGAVLRNGLVVFQFMISIVLIASTLVVSQQMDFMQAKSLGYNKDQIVVVERMFALQGPNVQTFIEELKRLPDVENAAGSFILLGGERPGDSFGEQWTSEGSSEILTTKSTVIDDDFSTMIGFEFVAGRGFSKETHDSLSLILNETAVKTFELTDPIGKKLNQVLNTPQGQVTVSFTIIGVVKDFNFQSLHDPITPLTIRSNESFNGGAVYAYARVKGKNTSSALAGIENLWKALAPGQPFKYIFLDENLNAQYENEKRAGQIFSVFSALAILIACVGLFGLAAYTGNQRTKEIGVRKVLGASVGSVVMLLSKDFTKLILIAFVLAVPLSWYVMNNWLENFAYRINPGVGVFLASGLTAIVISWITVSYQSIKAAIVNPVKSLRSE
jgi:putative ABC transport system permease protein